MAIRQSAEEIEVDAARWVVRLDREGRTPRLDAELRAWLAGDSRRQGALLVAEASWFRVDELSRLGEAASAPPRRPLPLLTTRRAAIGAGGAALAAAFAGIAILSRQGDVYRTGVGEIRRVPLADRSIAAINTASQLDVRFTPERRRVRMKDGEAWFQVAKNPRRPFVVEAGPVRVEAVGTAFSVRRRGNGADVLVTEGVVRAWVEGAEARGIRLVAGTSAFIRNDAAVAGRSEDPTEVDRRLAWRTGQIDLAGQTLAEAVAEINRYNPRQIRIVDPGVGRERLYGAFRTDDPEGFARSAAISLRVAAHAPATGDIVIGEPSGR